MIIPSSLVKMIIEVRFPSPLALTAATLILYGTPASVNVKCIIIQKVLTNIVHT